MRTPSYLKLVLNDDYGRGELLCRRKPESKVAKRRFLGAAWSRGPPIGKDEREQERP